MPRVQRRVLGLADDPARRVHRGEALGEAGEVAEVLHLGVAAYLALAHERRPVDGAESHGVVSDVDGVRGVAGLHVERAGRLGDLFEQEVGIEPDDVVLDLLPGLAEQFQGPGRSELHADVGDQPSPPPVERGHRILAEDFVAGHGIAEHARVLPLLTWVLDRASQ